MAYARLRIDKYLEGEELADGAIVDIRRLDGTFAPGARNRTSVPMGTSGYERVEILDPGTYEFTAILPSGNVLSKVVEIDERPDGVQVVFDIGHSSHEWLSWQHALGKVVGAQTLQEIRAHGVSRHWSSVMDVRVVLHEAPPAFPGSPDDVAASLAAHLAHVAAAGEFQLDFPFTELVSQDEPPFRMYRIQNQGFPGQLFPIHYSGQFWRRYALVSDSANHVMLCVLPFPWTKQSGIEASVELLVGPDQPLDAEEAIVKSGAPWAVSTIARDDYVASVLSYFASGDDSAAAFLAMKAEEMLFAKMTNPLAASAGAYVLVDQWLRQRDTEHNTDDWRAVNWLGWINNLADWFPWLPDGEILRGWVALADSAHSASVETARTAFVEAERRGIPFYTAGIRRLADGLARIANQDEAEGRSDLATVVALDRIRRIAWGTDSRFPFTTIRLSPVAI
ncbi:hypothetical protein WM34_27130 [Burkholderia ubonensis]|uniref:hypothetical protein n=1 Tax=Burkholderia ubonensis TaxID=101571 RepID=UPI00075D0DFA|nr:hypothetical protein [Burkholderia ubonensis]KWD09324.1 hypothetical protein WL59_04620 [Burkholderia ubonensis]KWD26297.1 hypothetical protein WL60_29685 [Burkholderia ubonensis]KWQ01758.1 hypothetical protein WM34_27130 [Burkholderia ubonensis]